MSTVYLRRGRTFDLISRGLSSFHLKTAIPSRLLVVAPQIAQEAQSEPSRSLAELMQDDEQGEPELPAGGHAVCCNPTTTTRGWRSLRKDLLRQWWSSNLQHFSGWEQWRGVPLGQGTRTATQ